MHSPTSTNLKYFLYARKSSENEDRQMASIDSQIDELTKLANQNGIEIVRVFSESKSAKAPGREVYADMIARIKRGEAKGIVCWKLNRLARNPIDGGEISWMIQQGIIQHIQTFGRSYYPTDNVIVMAVELGMANQFIRDLSVDTKRGLKTKAEAGWYPSPAPLGYANTPDRQKGIRIITKDPEQFENVERIFRYMLTGNYTPEKLRKIATNEWGLKNKDGKKVARSTIYRILSDPFYYGKFEYPKGSGNWYEGKHEPMITQTEHFKIREILGGDLKPRPQNREFAFTGMMRCKECGSAITAELKMKRQKNGNVHYYTYYHCTKKKGPCSQGSIREDRLEEQIAEELEKIEIPEEFKEWAMEMVRKENEKESKSIKTVISEQQKAYNECIEKIDVLIDMRASLEITSEQFSEKKKKLEIEKERLNELMNDSDKAIGDWVQEAEELFELAELARERFKYGDLQKKKEMLAALGSNLSIKDGKLNIEAKNKIIAMKKISKEVKEINNRLEPPNNPIIKGKPELLYSGNPILLRGGDSNPRPIGYI
jgi:site-specific DNA recombinase